MLTLLAQPTRSVRRTSGFDHVAQYLVIASDVWVRRSLVRKPTTFHFA